MPSRKQRKGYLLPCYHHHRYLYCIMEKEEIKIAVVGLSSVMGVGGIIQQTYIPPPSPPPPMMIPPPLKPPPPLLVKGVNLGLKVAIDMRMPVLYEKGIKAIMIRRQSQKSS